jgi:hypothetical protein
LSPDFVSKTDESQSQKKMPRRFILKYQIPTDIRNTDIFNRTNSRL